MTQADQREEPAADGDLPDPAIDSDDDVDDDLFGDAFQAPRRTSKLTVVLVVALFVVGGFAGGVLVQKHHDVALAAAAAGVTPPRRASGTGGGAGRGPGGASATPAPGAAAGAGGADAAAPVVEGTVRTVEDGAIEVTATDGAVVRVFVPATATVTTLGLAGLKFNTPVSVAGTKEVDGSIDATSVTVRRTG